MVGWLNPTYSVSLEAGAIQAYLLQDCQSLVLVAMMYREAGFVCILRY
jgi:hypothetical protein